MRAIHREIVSAILFANDGKMLQARQTDNELRPYPGMWAIIGGGVDEGESEREALDREFLEETGIDISGYPAELVFESNGDAEKSLRETGERVLVHMNFHTYRVTISDKNSDDVSVTLNDEHSEYRWVFPQELETMHLTPPSVELFTKLGYLS